MGHSVSDSLRKLVHLKGDGRMESVSGDQKYKVVVDYAHTPDALRNVLSMLRECTPEITSSVWLWRIEIEEKGWR